MQISNLQKKIMFKAKWKCHDCNKWYFYKDKLPSTEKKVKVVYEFTDGIRGAPPFSKPYNDNEIIGTQYFCGCK